MASWYDMLDQADLDAHVAAADPHTAYQKESEKDAVGGYVGLGADSQIACAPLLSRLFLLMGA